MITLCHKYTKMALRGIKVVELAGLAPGPFCGMILSDFGASVIRVDKVGVSYNFDCLANGKQSLALNLKDRRGISIFRQLCKTSDVLIETYRAGVMENMGLGPDVLMSDNSKLIYTRLSGYGQFGNFAKRAGHDINYVALSGLLSLLGRQHEKPFPPINLLADFSGGGLLASLGILMALFERSKSELGQVIDCNMVEGTAYLGSWIFRSQILPFWGNERGKNMLDGGAPFYDVYDTKDGKYVAVGAIESKFYKILLDGLGFTEKECPQFDDWENNKKKFSERFLQKTQEEWGEIFNNVDACVTPVLTKSTVAEFPHNAERNTFVVDSDQTTNIPQPAPKLSRTPAHSQATLPQLISGRDTKQILLSLNYSEKEILELEREGVIQTTKQSKL